ncbi:hypothetical protein [Pseudomonas lini]|uniref:Uncharacterized protein n=1 Tax=Pseudomonas lini TaxID=163011 RepID=A0A0J6KFN2_9PSED|nr:hypothetical protein [Pseudomonas lini]KAB0502754.1 hypothetical protein F7R14_19130 [Pseudomonas lini]KMM94962.1 hypothetical protein TU81_00615 [Pseudomonas lini]SDT22949.1 hypothetical protein SAMN04490191_3573 [Pseudomonas lini]
MNITLYGQRYDDEPFELIKQGDSLLINGEEFDLSPLPEGGSLPGSAVDSQWFALGQIERVGGNIQLSLLYPIPANFSPEQSTPKVLGNPPDGPVSLPQPLPEPVLREEAGE